MTDLDDRIKHGLFVDRASLIADHFTIADAYLSALTNCANFTGIDVVGRPKLAAYVTRVASRPARRRPAHLTHERFAHISQLMEVYFKGPHNADSNMLRRVFEARLTYVRATAGDGIHLDLEAYMAVIDAREAPASLGEELDTDDIEITAPNDRMAHVTARIAMLAREYLDFLMLVRAEAGWRIISNLFTYTERKTYITLCEHQGCARMRTERGWVARRG